MDKEDSEILYYANKGLQDLANFVRQLEARMCPICNETRNVRQMFTRDKDGQYGCLRCLL